MANEVLVAILLTLTAAGLAVMYYQQVTPITTKMVQEVPPQTRGPLEKYISVFRTTLTEADESLYKLSVTLYNGGT